MISLTKLFRTKSNLEINSWQRLVEEKRFADAEPLVEAEFKARALMGEEAENSGLFYEQWGDYATDEAEKKELYGKADYYFSIYASWSTSGGEGTARMRAVNRVREKIAVLDEN